MVVTDKYDGYKAGYDKHLRGWPKQIRILELGSLHGGGMEMLRGYFPDAEIVGYDWDDNGVADVIIGLQQDVEKLRSLGSFDIIIDDCSHIGEYTRTSFWTLFRYNLKPGGLYIIEDWDTAYNPKRIDGAKRKPMRRLSGMTFLDRVVNGSSSWFIRHSFGRIKRHFLRKKIRSHQWGMAGFIKELLDYRENIESIEFIWWQVFVRKSDR